MSAPRPERHTAAAAPDHVPGMVRQLQVGGYMVASRTTVGGWWLVYGGGCSCPAGQARRRCWHQRQVQAFVAKLDADRKRPTAPTNISALVD